MSRTRTFAAWRRLGGGKAAAALAGLVLAGPLLAGCSSHSTPDTPKADSTPVTTREPSPLPSLSKSARVAKDVKLATCELGSSGEVTASGTLTNTAKKAADFAITIAWMPNNSADPVAVASTTVAKVAPKAGSTWSVKATLTGKADCCAINARRGTLS